MSLWSKLPWRARRSTDEFADAVRGELAEMRVPAADERLLARILESRRRGDRVILPVEDARRKTLFRNTLFYASAVAAAAAAIVVSTRLTELQLKGFTRPVTAHEILGLDAARVRT